MKAQCTLEKASVYLFQFCVLEMEVTKGEVVLCWTLLASVISVSALFSTLCVFGLCYQLGKPTSMCTSCVKRNSSLTEDSLHYASLKHIKGRLTTQGLPGLAQGNVTS
ncbi:uncharacterized protein LOC105005652 isoform X2 [Esox lucius]|uniref:uncharacterized protein LOC105005652 isoform X2 n=1 Tax=Esox lucius TaxID=8010 RepID=UPI001476BDFA|nr:uncharacterized protein LOC105005652 isoform X2 [Esox lucius]